jgi:hypothetical protein
MFTYSNVVPFVVHFTMISVTTVHRVERWDGAWVMNLKDFRRKWYHIRICLEGLRRRL